MAKKKISALALIPPQMPVAKVKRKNGPNRADLIRWYLRRKGHSDEEIGARTGCGVKAVNNSISVVEEYRELTSNDMVDMKIGEVVMKAMDDVPAVFRRGLTAKRVVRHPGTGRAKTEHDVGMQLKTVETIKSFQELARPRTPGVMLNQQFNNGASPDHPQGSGMSFESRLRAIREKRGMLNEENVIEVTAEEADSEMSLEEELAEQDIDIEEAETDEGSA